MSLAVRLSPTLQAYGLTLEDISDRTPFSLETLQDIECDKYQAFRLSTLETLKNAIGCDISELLVEQP